MVRSTTCPVCSTTLAATSALESSFFPFCSKRCREIDLLRWSQGKYAIIDPLTPDKLAENYDPDEDGDSGSSQWADDSSDDA